ncbi:hypothetical protein CIB84_013455 [Bambusicola thoracicus]|uniref:Uncharacterized protein n=1 Tax=Bambusicola thoracicus TaxID=9083 RepID=A0A2P4SFA4_BAMTH|nr:hypothetical protein CIB84_013455 [Bambusicola thoracicus]
MRVSQALSLMNEMLSESVMLPASEHSLWSRARSPQECRKQHIVSAKGFPCCRGHPNNRVLSERSRTAVRPRFGQKGHHFTPALGSARSKGKNRHSFVKAYSTYLVKVTTGFGEGGVFIHV